MAWFHNHYRHSKCRTSWSDEWSCACDDECPKCGRDISPHESDDLSVVIDADAGTFSVLLSPPTAGNGPDYMVAETFPTEIEAEAFRAKLVALLDWDFKIGKRDARINTDHPGEFMVAESHEESELPTKDGSSGPWCIVGDDFAALVNEAYKVWSPEYEEQPIPADG